MEFREIWAGKSAAFDDRVAIIDIGEVVTDQTADDEHELAARNKHQANAMNVTKGDSAQTTIPVSRFLTYRLSRLQSRLNAQAARMVQEAAGLSLTQWRVLGLLGGCSGATASELCRLSSIDKGLFSRTLKTLVTMNLVNSSPDESDSRVYRLSLTQSGSDLYDRIFPIMAARQVTLQQDLEPHEVAVLFSALEKLETAALGHFGE